MPVATPTAARVVCLCLFAFLAYGQQADVATDLVDCTGMVQPADGASAIELDGPTGITYRTEVDNSGSFRFGRIPAGEYRGRILSPDGDTINSIFVSVYRTMGPLVLRAPEGRRTISGSGPQTVSVALLQHKVPSKARKQMDLAIRAEKKKDTPAEIDHLRQAIALDPDYMEAHNSLGIAYIGIERSDLALAEFQKALAIDPHQPGLQTNVSLALLSLHQPGEAEVAARRSVDLDGSSAKAHYLVAVALVQQGKITPEIEKHLRLAMGEMPGARLLLAQVLIDTGQFGEGR